MADVRERTSTKAWMCLVCGWMYYEELRRPDDGIFPGTRWADIPDDRAFPECGAANKIS